MRLCHRKQDDFNPRARVGRDVRHFLHALNAVISIHAPAWGATQTQFILSLIHDGISIHAPAWGATLDRVVHAVVERISIHAPAWGATSRIHADNDRRKNFNPRARVGRDGFGAAQ